MKNSERELEKRSTELIRTERNEMANISISFYCIYEEEKLTKTNEKRKNVRVRLLEAGSKRKNKRSERIQARTNDQ